MVILTVEDELRARTREGKLRAAKCLVRCHRDCWNSMDKIASYAESTGAAPDDIDGLPCHSDMGIIIDAVAPGETLAERKFDIEKAVKLVSSTELRVVDCSWVEQELDARAFADEYGSRRGAGPRRRKLPW